MNKINQLVVELKENEQDFEFYPTTKEMIRLIYNRIDYKADILDIGCGTCNLKKFFKEFNNEKELKYRNDIKLYNEGKLERYPNSPAKWHGKYYVIEKSKILLDKLDKDTIVLGIDFHKIFLLDKKADVYFCNPPYSEYVEWTRKILSDGNFNFAYMVIPQRWKNSERINNIIKNYDIQCTILGSFDFLNAERSARAKVDVIEFRKCDYSKYGNKEDLKDFNEKAFNKWFDETFKMRDSSKENKQEYELEREAKEKIKTQLVNCESKGKMLVELYNNEQMELFEHFKAICSLDTDVLKTINIEKEAVKEAIKHKVKTLKIRYWKIVFDEFEVITNRLTSKTRNQMFDRFKALQTVDFTLENIYPLILWVIKNANEYYNEQLISFFKTLSSPENIKNYKSNKRVFELDGWRHNYYFKNPEKVTHYTLDYRIIMSSPFDTDYRGNLKGFHYNKQEALQDIFTIAKNLGFKIGLCDLPTRFQEKNVVLYENSDNVFMEYRVYKNGNMHVKFDIEFAKALNVECSRLLGWIRNKEDIQKEFPEQLAKGAEKYFKQNYTCIGCNSLLLTTTKLPTEEVQA